MSMVEFDPKDTLEILLGDETLQKIAEGEARAAIREMDVDGFVSEVEAQLEIGAEVEPISDVRNHLEELGLGQRIVATHERGCRCRNTESGHVWDEGCVDKNDKTLVIAN